MAGQSVFVTISNLLNMDLLDQGIKFCTTGLGAAIKVQGAAN